MKTTDELPNPADFMQLGEDAFNKNVHEKLREKLNLVQSSIQVYKKEATDHINNYLNSLNGNR